MTRMAKALQVAGAACLLGLGLGTTAMGCLNRPIDVLKPRTTSTVVERLQQNGVDKIDLLLAIDNSISMADKQAILAAAVPDLVNRLVTPNCVDDMGVANGTVVDANGECATGKPEFPPIRNINIGIISSSLGDLTSGACNSPNILDPDDHAHLITRGGAGTVPTYQNKGFLAWDPDNQREGETNATNLANSMRDLVVGVDQVGCGYEMQLESILRFLVDPDPYLSVTRNGNYLKEEGTDTDIIAERKDFLRPDSLLAILILSDENDCSIAINDQGFLALGGPFYRSTSECADDPNDACCKSCGLDHTGCDTGGNCAVNGGKYAPIDDHANLKCWNQKQRYGVNFLYPVQRYINAFTLTNIDPGRTDYAPKNAGDGVTNPLFTDLSGEGGSIRSNDLVFVAGIVGVPWQALARRDGSNNPDLSLGFKTYSELEPDLDALVGDPDSNKPPTDPFMQESMAPRSGTSDILGATLPGDNPINGRDYNVFSKDDLQYACIFPLDTPVTPGPDCGDCTAANNCNNPLCQGVSTTQVNAKAYPGLREMALLRGMGSQGIFASICPAETGDVNASDYGYRPAVNAIIDRLKEELGGQCLARTLTPDPEGNVPCLVLEAAVTHGNCSCNPDEGRSCGTDANGDPLTCAPATDTEPGGIPKDMPDGSPNPTFNAVNAAKNDPFANGDWDCFCEIVQLADTAREECQTNPDAQATSQGDGWCYVDATTVPPTGDPALVSSCPEDERRLVRFVGDGDPNTGTTVFITCSGE
ncbi:MAG: hypothetical protein U0271_18075 [Polyangiaceae bacterium]